MTLELTPAERQRYIDALIADWFDSIDSDGAETVDTILRKGFAGYENYTDEQLLKEYTDAFDADDDGADLGDGYVPEALTARTIHVRCADGTWMEVLGHGCHTLAQYRSYADMLQKSGATFEMSPPLPEEPA